MIPKPPRLLLLSVLLLSLYCAATGAVGAALGVIGDAWFVFAFSLVTLLASLFGVAVGLGRSAEAPALATLCVGGCVFVGAVLAEPTFVARVLEGSSVQSRIIAGVNLRFWALSHVGVGAALIALSGLIVLARRPSESLRMLLRGALFAAPVVVCLGLLAAPSIRARVATLPQAVIVSLVIVAFFVLGVLLSIAVQNVIRAFEIAIPDAAGDPSEKAGAA